MTTRSGVFAVAASFAMLIAAMQPTPVHAGTHAAVVIHDARAAAIVDPQADVEKLAGGFGFTEGPVWDARGGYLLFSDIPGNVIWKLVPGEEPEVHLANAGYDGPEIWRVGAVNDNGFDPDDPQFERFAMIGPNGLALDSDGRLVMCTFAGRALVRIELDGTRTVLADGFDGQRFNGTNDLVIARDGSIYFTDTLGGLRGLATDPRRGVPTPGLFRWQDGKVTRLAPDMTRVNGLAFSPEQTHLYVNASSANDINRYEVLHDGSLGRGELFFRLDGDPAEGGADGMKVDSSGNIYVTGPGGIWIVSPEGTHLATLRFPERPVNMAFGGADMRTLFVTAHTGIYAIRVGVAGP